MADQMVHIWIPIDAPHFWGKLLYGLTAPVLRRDRGFYLPL